jgi:hypothetical protein
MPGPCDPFLRFEIEEKASDLFSLLFQHGVHIRSRSDANIEEILVHHLGIAREYLERRLSTVFLDGSPVDDISTTVISSGMTLALSSSMPGLAGATLRRQGIFAPMRRSITYHAEGGHPEPGIEGHITIKLFNILAGEVGPVLLKHGIWVEASKLAEYIRLNPQKEALIKALGRRWPQGADDLIRTLDDNGPQAVEIITT